MDAPGASPGPGAAQPASMPCCQRGESLAGMALGRGLEWPGAGSDAGAAAGVGDVTGDLGPAEMLSVGGGSGSWLRIGRFAFTSGNPSIGCQRFWCESKQD